MLKLATTLLALSAVLLAYPQCARAERFLKGNELSFVVKGWTPQELAERPNVNYYAPDKFPNYESLTGFTLKTSVKRDEWNIGERLDLVFEAGRSGYVSIIDYGPDGVARVLMQNRAVSARFRYSFSGEISEPAGDDYLRAVLTSTPLSYASYKSLCECPFAPEKKVSQVINESWLLVRVRASRRYPYDFYDDDPFYRWPHRWHHHFDGERYLYIQPYRDTVLSRGIRVATNAQVFSDLTEYGPAEYWLIRPGDRVEVEFAVESLPIESSRIYLLVYMTTDVLGDSGVFPKTEHPRLRIRFNGITITDEYTPRYSRFYDDSPPEIIQLADYLRYGGNLVELQLNPFGDLGVRLLRLEVRTHLAGLEYYENGYYQNDEGW